MTNATPDSPVHDFQKDVLDRSHVVPVLVDFWAPWCAPCRTLGPVLDKLADEAAGRFVLVKLNTDEQSDVAAQWRISSIPAVKLFVDGAVRAEFAGALPEPAVRRFIDQHIPNATQKSLANAEALVHSGEVEQAQTVLETLLADDPDHEGARALLAFVVWRSEPERALKLAADIGEGRPDFARASAARTLARLVLAQRGQGDGASVLADSPVSAAVSEGLRDYRAGSEALAQGRFGEALESFIGVVRQDRRLDDDGARRACVALFLWLGEDHALTREHRRAFSSALF